MIGKSSIRFELISYYDEKNTRVVIENESLTDFSKEQNLDEEIAFKVIIYSSGSCSHKGNTKLVTIPGSGEVGTDKALLNLDE